MDEGQWERPQFENGLICSHGTLVELVLFPASESANVALVFFVQCQRPFFPPSRIEFLFTDIYW